MPIYVQGLAEITAAYQKLGSDTVRGMPVLLRAAAEPVRHDAEALAQGRIVRIGRKWWKMRTGVTRQVVYVAPQQRGLKGHPDDPRRRPNLADLLMDEAMEPALKRNEVGIELAVDAFLDRVIADFNH